MKSGPARNTRGAFSWLDVGMPSDCTIGYFAMNDAEITGNSGAVESDCISSIPALIPLSYKSDVGDEWVPIAAFGEKYEAHLAAGKLEDSGLHAAVADGTMDVSRLYSGRGGSILRVRKSDLAAAVAVLEQTPARHCLVVARAMPAGGPMCCPQCSSEKVYSPPIRALAFWLKPLMFLFDLKPARQWTCRSCRHSWQAYLEPAEIST